jgi:Mg-chelatase subunit ChlD
VAGSRPRWHRGRVGSCVRTAAAVAACLAGISIQTSPVVAQGCATEVEPNDALESALAVTGPACATGELAQDDVVDHLLLWTIAPGEAERWDLGITSDEGSPVILAVSRVTSDPAALTLSVEPNIVEIRTVEGLAEPALHRDLWLGPGRYLVSVGPDGPWTGTPKAYQVDITLGSPLPGSADQEPNDETSSGSPLEGAFEVSGDAATTDDHFAWQVPETDQPGLWSVEVESAMGTSLALSISDAEGTIEGDTRSLPDGTAHLPDLRLEPGTHTIRLIGTSEPARRYVLRAYRQDVPFADPEPNDDPAHALPIVPGELMAGRLGRASDRDVYRLSVDEALGSSLIDARLILLGGPPRRLCLAGLTPVAGGVEAARELTCSEGSSGATLDGLLLTPGDYELSVSGASSLVDSYYLRVDTSVAPLAGFELEPNDSPELATPMTPAEPMRGRLDNVDHLRVHIDGEPQLWQIEAQGPGVRVVWIRTDGYAQALGTDPDGTGARSVITDAYLIPGEQWLRLDGTGEYSVTLEPLGPLLPDGEREPNDALAFANTLPMDGSVTGRIGTGADHDVYRFSLPGPEHVRLTLEPPPDQTMRLYAVGETSALLSSRETPAPGERVELDLVLPAGDHAFDVLGSVSPERYRLSLERLDPFELAVDQEPNDQPEAAVPMPPDLVAAGVIEHGDQGDWYRLDPLPAAGELTIRAEGVVDSLTVDDGVTRTPLVAEADGTTYRSPSLPPGASLALGVTARGAYALEVDPGATGLVAAEVAPGGLPIELALELEATEAAAFEAAGQRVPGRLSVTNAGDEPLDILVDGVTSHPDWTVELGSAEVALEPGAASELPVALVAPAEAWGDVPVRATIRARSGRSAATAFAEVIPRADAPLVGPFRWWDVPNELLGGLDAAATGLGAVVMPSLDATAEASLHDGVVALGAGMDVSATLPQVLSVDLAGDEPVPVAGVVLDPTSAQGTVAGTVRGFELLLSEDGVTYERALSGELSGALTDQSFVLAEPIPARYAQLRVISRFAGAAELRLGEWKVVATPGWMPQAEPLDIAAPARGGHVAWLDPQANSPDMLDAMLTPDAALPLTLGYDPQETSEAIWVIGFQDGRAAQVTEIGWHDPPGSQPDLRLGRIDIATSMVGPLGPWTTIGTWDLERDGGGMVAPFRLATPTWMRYVRMRGRFADQARGVVELPDGIRVLERGPGDDYRSVVGEWGYASSAGPWEWQQPVPEAAGCHGADAVDALATSDRLLEAGTRVRGCVARGVTEDGYTITVPEGQRSARFSVTGRPTVGVGLRLIDASGSAVPLAASTSDSAGQVEYLAAVSPGARYELVVAQPPFSVVVLFDTSGSVGPFVPIMTSALRNYLGGIVEGEEALQLFDLEGPPLPEEFSDDPWLILNALDAHAGSVTGSSSAESGLIDGLDALAARTGTRAIFLMTDAETGSFHRQAEAWRWLSLVQPRLFTMQVSGAHTPQLDERFMQDWAAVGGGAYAMTRYGGDIERAFERMGAWLRRPADYGLVMAFSADPPPEPEPGSIRVVSDPNALPADGEADAARAARAEADVAVEIVLDTSGSMLERIGRRRRIDIAKRVLGRLVAEEIDPRTPVALRVFRQDRDSCETDLAVPLGPLDPAALAATIEAIDIDRTVKTPLAAAIAAVAQDLAHVTGPRVVIVVSDGQESCGGDPEAAVRSLVDQGFDVTLNVVGLDLDRKARRRIARLAGAGGGEYYDARDAAGLEAALKGALGAPYVILDAAGVEVGRGTVDGPPVELPPGTYRISLAGAAAALDAVVLESEERETVTAPTGAG